MFFSRPAHTTEIKMRFFKWLSGLVSNPATGNISHTKLWANVAAGTMTFKFMQTADAPEWLWWAYGAMVGGYPPNRWHGCANY